MKRAMLTTAVLVLLGAGGARGQSVRVFGRSELQFHTTSVGSEDVGEGVSAPAATEMELRRAHLGAEATVSDGVLAFIQVDFGDGVLTIKDAYADVRLAQGVWVRAGQYKKPFSPLALYGSPRLLTIERQVRIPGLEKVVPVPGEEQWLLAAGLYAGRQVGAMVHGAAGPLGYAAGVFNGEGANRREVSASKAYTARLTWTAAALVLGGGASVQPVRDADGTEVSGAVWGLDAEYGRFGLPGPHVLGEWMYGDDLALVADGAAPAMMGAQVAATYFIPGRRVFRGWEPVLRVSWADPDRGIPADAGLLLTPGVNLYFAEQSRFMLNWDAYVSSRSAPGSELESSFMAELQVVF